MEATILIKIIYMLFPTRSILNSHLISFQCMRTFADVISVFVSFDFLDLKVAHTWAIGMKRSFNKVVQMLKNVKTSCEKEFLHFR